MMKARKNWEKPLNIPKYPVHPASPRAMPVLEKNPIAVEIVVSMSKLLKERTIHARKNAAK